MAVLPLQKNAGVDVIELDMAIPFSAARARNAGFARLLSKTPTPEFVQFLDGDCELVPGWLEHATEVLQNCHDAAVVCGRVMERNLESSIYNRLCALEWDKPVGEIDACGGNFMVRARLFQASDGFREDVVAAEDDELCLRLRRGGGKILSVSMPMVWHDAAITRFSQWWTRATRAGHAYAQGAAMHGTSPERHFVRRCRRVWLWGIAVPALAVGTAWFTSGFGLLLLLGYPLLTCRIYRYGRKRGWSKSDAWLYAVFTVIAKWPELIGMLRYHRRRWLGHRPTIIEYKGAEKLA